MTLALRQTDVVLDDSGYPVVNGYFYVGTYQTDPVANPINLFSDAELSTPIANPQRTDSYGRPENDIYISESRYSYLIKNSAGTTIEGPKDRFAPTSATSIALDQGGNVQDAITYITPQMFGVVGDGSNDDTAAWLEMVAYCQTNSGKSIRVEMSPGLRVMLANAGAITWPNNMSLVDPVQYNARISEQNPVVVMNDDTSYMSVSVTTTAQQSDSCVSATGVNFVGYSDTGDRWAPTTSTGGNRSVAKLFDVQNCSVQFDGCGFANAVDLIDITNNSGGVFPEQIRMSRCRWSAYTNAIRCIETAPGTGSFEHMQLEGFIQQGLKAATADTFMSIEGGASVYRSRIYLMGHAHGDGSVGSILKLTGSTFSQNYIDWRFDRITINNLWDIDATSAMRQNQGCIDVPSSDGVPETIDASATVGENNLDIRGPDVVVGGVTLSSGSMLVAKSRMWSGVTNRAIGDPSSVSIAASGTLTSGTVHGILPAYRFGVDSASGRQQRHRIVSVDYYCGTAPSGNTNGGWMFNVNRTGVSIQQRIQIPDGSTFGTIRIGVNSTGAAEANPLINKDYTTGTYDNPMTVASTTATGSVNNGTAPSDVFLCFNIAWL